LTYAITRTRCAHKDGDRGLGCSSSPKHASTGVDSHRGQLQTTFFSFNSHLWKSVYSSMISQTITSTWWLLASCLLILIQQPSLALKGMSLALQSNNLQLFIVVSAYDIDEYVRHEDSRQLLKLMHDSSKKIPQFSSSICKCISIHLQFKPCVAA
jgi:hypothetical protein